jgi:hypothetical protein
MAVRMMIFQVLALCRFVSSCHCFSKTLASTYESTCHQNSEHYHHSLACLFLAVTEWMNGIVRVNG